MLSHSLFVENWDPVTRFVSATGTTRGCTGRLSPQCAYRFCEWMADRPPCGSPVATPESALSVYGGVLCMWWIHVVLRFRHRYAAGRSVSGAGNVGWCCGCLRRHHGCTWVVIVSGGSMLCWRRADVVLRFRFRYAARRSRPGVGCVRTGALCVRVALQGSAEA